MKKRNSTISVLAILVITLGNLIVFYDRIDSKISDAGFWLILVFGMSLGISIDRFFLWRKTSDNSKS